MNKINQSSHQIITKSSQNNKFSNFIFYQNNRNMYFSFFSIMKAFCKNFQFIPEQNELFINIIVMNINFYKKQQQFSRAQEVKRAYKRKLCAKEKFLSTLFRWLHEWGRRKLAHFLKQNIQSIEKDLLLDLFENNSQTKQQIINIKSSLALDGTLKKISNSQRLTFKQNNNKISLNNMSLVKDLQQQTQIQHKNQINLNNTDKLIKNQIFMKSKLQIQFSDFPKNQINQIQDDSIKLQLSKQIHKPQSYNNLTNFEHPVNIYRKKQILLNCRQKLPSPTYVNKQIFYGTYWQQMNLYYKNFNCIEDLDGYYLKTFKKQNIERKIQIIKDKLKDIVESMIKAMPHIKRSMQNYQLEYQDGCPVEVKTKINSKRHMCRFNEQIDRKMLWNNIFSRNKSNEIVYRTRVNLRSQNSYYYRQGEGKNTEQAESSNIQSQIKRDLTTEGVLNRGKLLYEGSDKFILPKNHQKQIKLPIVYNPENICMQSSITASNPSIHHTKQKSSAHQGRLVNKGIVRYKFISREPQKIFSPHEAYEKLNDHCSSQMLESRSKEYEVPNIRKILRKREQQKNIERQHKVNEGQTYKNYYSDIHINSQNQTHNNINGDKYLIFLKNSFHANLIHYENERKFRVFQGLDRILPVKQTSYYKNNHLHS